MAELTLSLLLLLSGVADANESGRSPGPIRIRGACIDYIVVRLTFVFPACVRSCSLHWAPLNHSGLTAQAVPFSWVAYVATHACTNSWYFSNLESRLRIIIM